MRYPSLIFELTLLVGYQIHHCHTEREKLAMRNPSLKSKWTQLCETSVSAEEERFAERIRTWQSLLKAFRQKFGGTPGVVDYAAGVRE
jgi:hypothetical protein